MRYLNNMIKRLNAAELTENDLEDYQLQAVEFLKKNPRSALFIDTGLGKTAISLKLIRELIDADKIKRVLIIAPLKVANQTWGDEIQKWSFSAPLGYKLIRDEELNKQIRKAGSDARKKQFTQEDWDFVEASVKGKMRKELRHNPIDDPEIIKTLEEQFRQSGIKERKNSNIKKARIATASKLYKQYEAENPTFITIVNQELIEQMVDAWGADDWIYDCVIYDESDALKDSTTKRWAALYSIAHKVKHFHQLTATPAAESYMGLFAQMKLLDNGKRLGKNITQYRNKYFDINPYNYKTTLKEGAADEITRAISDITLVMKQEDYLSDVAPYEIEDIKYSLPKEAVGLYEDMRNNAMVTVNGVDIVVKQAVSVLQKLMQISAGFVYDSNETIDDFGSFVKNRKIYNIHTAKVDALRELMVRYPNDNFLISYYHQGSLELLQQHFPEAVKMSRDGREKNAWNAKKIKMLLMHPKSGAHGLNLQKGGRIIINYDVYFSYGQFYQFLRRLARRGQEADKVLVFNLIGESTYDELVANWCFRGKAKAQAAFFDMITAVKRELKKGLKNG